MGSRKDQDSYYRRAKQEGFAARSVYKLQEMDQRYGLLRQGMRVLDIGCHPGSWLQYAAGRVGPGGLVLGVDIQELAVDLPRWGRFIQADVLKLTPAEVLAVAPAFDVVLSDVAPRTTGVRHADEAASLAMLEAVFDLALAVLRPGGSFLAKVYFGPGVDQLIHQVKGRFKLGKGHKPAASKAASKEIYILGRELKNALPQVDTQTEG
ncbi:ribosomal RNA methyltransferase RrmJ/FtsJ [Desulfarculus baarsii DSM 2075]|uniref:Ribosomal RNA large subunit methyltransferase E n=1 Tax=Desulfarculus baarsii (strain ATCC 33931 / DSM 2075 / LMG 7858 / VKM B-1802 / 2st14) TaxID=644282 RepID=E1QM08_DESB2|nr:RlmE family RNA methyltransferase [Desulfarculus baarsii]ADK86593.1 ribosomal RNA methyltransferase RrmJ/FtsJ [Desulfarculus baarsii DSM 2075]